MERFPAQGCSGALENAGRAGILRAAVAGGRVFLMDRLLDEKARPT